MSKTIKIDIATKSYDFIFCEACNKERKLGEVKKDKLAVIKEFTFQHQKCGVTVDHLKPHQKPKLGLGKAW